MIVVRFTPDLHPKLGASQNESVYGSVPDPFPSPLKWERVSNARLAADIVRNKTEASKKILSPRVHRLPGDVKWVRHHGML